MALSANKYYLLIRKIIYKFSILEKSLKFFLNLSRLSKAESILNETNIHTKNIKSFLGDYKFSIKYTHRTLPQVINLENIVLYLKENELKGSIVETGTFTGGASAFLLLSLLRNFKDKSLPTYWGFDSFEGMPNPVKEDGNMAFNWITGKNLEQFNKSDFGKLTGHNTNKADFEECLNYLIETKYPQNLINLKKGWFQDSLPKYKNKIGDISLLRLDGDLYESTMVVLENLYEKVTPGGIVIIDDYGAFIGCKKAVDTFRKKENIDSMLHYVDESIRYFIKPKR